MQPVAKPKPPSKSYGLGTYRARELVLSHSLGELPEPKLTRDLF